MGDKSVAYKASKTISFIQILIGGFFTVMFGLMLFIFIIDALFIRETEPLEAYDYFILLILLALSAFLMSRGVKRKKFLKLTKDYTIRLNADPYKSTITLANSLGIPENQVIDNLSKMIRKNYFTGAAINHAEHRVYMPGQTQSPNPGMQTTAPAPAVHTVNEAVHAEKTAPAACTGCGAINHFDPHSPKAVCEYCGTPLGR